MSDVETTSRQEYVSSVKKELKYFNFALPPNPMYINPKWEDVIKQHRPLRELYVRLNVFAANGQMQKGTITFVEANRIIEYNFEEDVSKCYVRFKSMKH